MKKTIFSLLAIFLILTEGANAMEENTNNTTVEVTTNLGKFQIKLNADKAPLTVKNFLQYTKDGHYDNTIFHRVIDGFMVQGGGFTSDFNQKETRKAIKNEAENGLKNKRGTVAMARTSDVDSATSQFFINTVDNSFLDFRGKNPQEYGYCVFGEVTTGMDVIDKIEQAKTGNRGMHGDVPVETIEITSIKKIS